MKILVVCQYYYPEPFRITDICEELIKRGHEVTVITGIPNYPMGKIYDGYRFGQRRDEMINGVVVHRCFTIGRRSGVLYRILNYYSYAISSSLYTRKLATDFDIVLINQLSPVLMANAGIKYKKKHERPLILYCLDLWPESLVAGGVEYKSRVYNIFCNVSSKIYHATDRILVTSKSFSKYFEVTFGIYNTQYLPQYAESIFSPEECQKTPNETIDLMFAGNLGAAQSVETIIRAAALTQDISNLRWHIVGDGSEQEKLKELSRLLNTSNVIFHGRIPLEKMPKYYAMADAMLVTMKRAPALSMTLPGKIQTYLAAGKPILGAIDGEARIVIQEANCGKCCEAEDAEALSKTVRVFIERNLCDEYSTNAFLYYEKYFTKERFMDNLIDVLSKEVPCHE